MPARVLIVDDHAGFRTIARQLLGASGYDVVGEAADGVSAIQAARLLRPDVVLLDVQLPDLDGLEVAKQLSAELAAPAIVLISSRDAADYGSRISRSGALGFVAKADLSGAVLDDLLGPLRRA